MELNNTTQYAIRVLNFMNTYESQDFYSARFLSEKLNIDYKFLTIIMTKLVKAEILKSIRGKSGGFILNKNPMEICLIDIIKLFDNTVDPKSCVLGIDKCDSKNRCSLHNKYLKPKKEIYKLFENTTLDDVKGQGIKL